MYDAISPNVNFACEFCNKFQTSKFAFGKIILLRRIISYLYSYPITEFPTYEFINRLRLFFKFTVIRYSTLCCCVFIRILFQIGGHLPRVKIWRKFYLSQTRVF